MAKRGRTTLMLLGMVLAVPAGAVAECGATPADESPSPATCTEAEAEEPGIKVRWNKGKTILESSGIRIELSNRLQPRWTGSWPDESGATGSFRVRRARTKLEGWVYDERVGFELQVDWADSEGILKDAFIDVDASGGGALRVQLGQYKVPFGRQQLTSSGSLQFVDRSITSSRFARGRDIGLMLHGELAAGRLSWAAGLFNGSGPLATRNDDGRYQLDARVQIAPNGDPGYSEADLERTPRPLYAIAVQFERDDQGLGDERLERETWGADLSFKFRGLSLFAEAFSARIAPRLAESLTSDGFALQAGYYLSRPSLELAGRYARFSPGAPGDDRTETGAALSWYRDAHRFKLQADLRFLDGGRLERDDTELRVQAQLAF